MENIYIRCCDKGEEKWDFKGQMGRAGALHYPLRHLPGTPLPIPLGISASAGCAFPGWANPSAQTLLHIYTWGFPLLLPNLYLMNKKLLAVFALVTICDKGLWLSFSLPKQQHSFRNPKQGTRIVSLEVPAPHPSIFPWFFPPPPRILSHFLLL